MAETYIQRRERKAREYLQSKATAGDYGRGETVEQRRVMSKEKFDEYRALRKHVDQSWPPTESGHVEGMDD